VGSRERPADGQRHRVAGRRTTDLCERWTAQGLGETIRAKTGLLLDAYFSATKLKWLLDSIPGARASAEQGRLACGTVDSWIIWNLTGGAAHITDASNASRTLLFNIHSLDWDPELLKLFDIPRSILPHVVPSSGLVAETAPAVLGRSVPIAGIAAISRRPPSARRVFRPEWPRTPTARDASCS